MNKLSQLYLWDLNQFALIILDAEGIEYVHQVGGNAIIKRTAKGWLMPLDTENNDAQQFYETFREFVPDSNTIDAIQMKIESIIPSLSININRGNPLEIMEAWLPCTVTKKQNNVSEFYEVLPDRSFQAILTYPNGMA